jgi:arsenical pump membrane protein
MTTRRLSVAPWLVAAVAGAAVTLTGWLPAHRARDVAISRGLPILGFLAAITVLAELSDAAGVFDWAADRCAGAAGGSSWRLFLVVGGLATVTTVVMSLDTTAVLLTPVVLTLTDRLGLRPLPFALLVVWLANAASLLLPVSNLTNLLAQQRSTVSTLDFVGRMALPELAAVVICIGYLALLHHRDLAGSYARPAPTQVQDRAVFAACGIGCLALAPAVVAGVTPWAAATPCAVLAIAAFAVRRRQTLRLALVPWRLLALTEGLFLVVAAVGVHGGTRLATRLVGHSTLATVGVAGATSNVANNLPTYLGIEPAVAHGNTTQLLGELIGTNAGPLVLVWGSLATLLWRERCRARNVDINWRTFALLGLGGVPLLLLGAWAALIVT